jgi:hypothetical protein
MKRGGALWLGAAFALSLTTTAAASPRTNDARTPAAVQASRESKKIYDDAVAAQKKGDGATAANAFARYVAEPSASPRLREKALTELGRLSPKLGRLGIDAEGAVSISVDGRTLDPPLPESVYVTAGAHFVEARFAEDTVSESATPVAGEEVRVTLAPRPKPTPAVETFARAPQQTKDRHKPLRPIVVYAGAGVTFAAAVLTVLSGLDTENQKDTFDKARTQQNLDAGRSRQLRTNVLLGVTGGLGLLTGVAAVGLVDWKRKDTSVKVDLGVASLRLSGAF